MIRARDNDSRTDHEIRRTYDLARVRLEGKSRPGIPYSADIITIQAGVPEMEIIAGHKGTACQAIIQTGWFLSPVML